ncbi:MAG: hypothetical protein MUF42_13455, partial [Cytophagaceae bacterium]|nr:hypothetical protein [Cytophagaceae bacterium]
MRRARVITSTLQQTSSLTQLLWPTLIGMLYLLAGYAVWDFWIYRPSPPPPPEPSRSELCMVPVKVMATITAVAHTGGAVSLPVGANTAALRKWSAASSWSGGTKPGAADDVLIPANAIIVLDETVNVRSITVQGRLIMDVTKNINVSANYIHVTGTTAYMEWGTRAQPYLFKGAITLTGSDVNAKIPGTTIPSKAILVGDGATLELNGEVKRSWLSLNANAAVGATQLSLSSATHNWDVGDEIVVTSSRVNWLEAEKRTITAISPDRLTITINSGLTFPHIGRSKSYTRPTDGKVWVGDMRAEIGVLTKSIKIQGDASSTANGFGAHVMIHKDGKAYVNHVEFYLVGQKSVLGSYPFHWHMLLDKGAGQYLKNSSIHSSFNRAVTIHGTESTLTENNFCYDHIGHGIFFEDGSERYNTVRGNVVLVTRRPAVGEELIPSDNEANEVQNRTPSSFWITNPNNTVENNIAAGTQGTGFWFAMPRSPMGFSASEPRFAGMQPYKEPLIRFKGNKAHSCVSGFDIFDQLTAAHGLIKNGGWERTDQRIMDSCTWYACDLAIYGGIGGGRNFTKDVIFRNNIFLDNVTSVMHANYAMVEQSAFVANSGENVFSGERKLNRGYDGSCTIKDCHMIGWQASNANYVQNTGGALKHVNYRITGMTMDHNGPPRMNFPSYAGVPVGDIGANSGAHPRFWSYIHWDMDGSFGGKA